MQLSMFGEYKRSRLASQNIIQFSESLDRLKLFVLVGGPIIVTIGERSTEKSRWLMNLDRDKFTQYVQIAFSAADSPMLVGSIGLDAQSLFQSR